MLSSKTTSQDMIALRAGVKQFQTTQMLLFLADLAAGVAHHVRTPLTTISGYLQMMLYRMENDRCTVRREVMETMLTEASYINNVVKELVLFANPPVQKQPDIKVNQLIEESLILTFKELGGENIDINKQLAGNLATITADANLLKQVLVNIMENAVEAMPERGTLGVRSWLNAKLNMLVIAISDTGTGMAPEIFARIFEPFYTTKLEGMGLGLPIAHRIINEHGGFIHISPGKTCGTEVHVYLPIVDQGAGEMNVVHQQVLNLQ